MTIFMSILVLFLSACGTDWADCADGCDKPDVVVIEGQPGPAGAPGRDGRDGESIAGPAGESGVDGAPGKDGKDGRDGVDGEDGHDGQDALPFGEWIDPCGQETTHDELILIMSNGRAFAWYYDRGIVELRPELTYATTDGTDCRFRIEDGELVEL